MSPVEFGIITIEVRTEVVVRERKGRVERSWTEERIKVWNEVECPDYVNEQRLETQTKATLKRTVNEMSEKLQKIASDT